jgi:DNA gyrase inhibitor GyrI
MSGTGCYDVRARAKKILKRKEKIMNKLDVRIVNLEPMRLASAYGFGSSPEAMAGTKMTAFLKSRNLLEGYGTRRRHFGFDNPIPSAGSPNYGYEIWVEVGPDVEPEGDIRIIDFCGGLYAVTRFENLENIGRVWQELVRWREGSKYKPAHHQCLENLHNPMEADPKKYVFELYLPISE